MALDFDGVDDVVDHGDIAVLDAPTAFTISFWLNYDTVSLSDNFVSKRVASTGFAVGSRIETTSFALTPIDAAEDHYGRINAITVDTWEHWTTVFNGGGALNADRLKIYKNGVNQTLTFVGTIPAAISDSGAATLRVMEGGTAFADGAVAHLKIWTDALSANEVLAEVASYIPVRTANLLLWSPYDDQTLARDYSGNANHGTVTQAVQIAGPGEVSYSPSVLTPRPSRRVDRPRRGNFRRLSPLVPMFQRGV